MRKLSLVAAILLLSSAWVLAQSGTAPSDQNPSSSSPSQTSPSQTSPSSAPSAQQPAQQPDTSQTAAAGSSVEGCVSGSAGNYTLTDASGKTYQLAGDTSKLADHVGHQVRITGDEGGGATGSASSGASSGAAGGSSTINVKKVKMISSSCPSK
jgi:cytoskeletal protein RodZ